MRKGREGKSPEFRLQKNREIGKQKSPLAPACAFPIYPLILTSNRQCLTHATLFTNTQDNRTRCTRQPFRISSQRPAYTVRHFRPTHRLFSLSARWRPLIRIALNAVLPFRTSSKNAPILYIFPYFARFIASVVIKSPYFVLNHK